jgi:T5SS/PEP-CTERM-associated repeat protein
MLIITNGGAVYCVGGYVGYQTNADNNIVTVAGSGSVWSNTSNLYIGRFSSGCLLTIADSGSVFNTAGHIGYAANSSNNTVTVRGPGSVWTCIADPTVGYYGSRNSLTITNGGSVFTTDAYIGYKTNANSNVATVTGPNSRWNITAGLQVGGSGSGNTLTIANGAAIFATGGGYVGYTATSSNNVATVTGSGSIWSNNADFVVGYYSFGNSLLITNGGCVFNNDGFIAYQTNANNNAVTVTGSGSVWICTGNLFVGRYGPSNTVTIVSNATVFANRVVVGVYSSSTENALSVADGNLVVTNGAGNSSLESRRGVITLDGGMVNADRMFVTNGSMSVFVFNGGTLSVKGGSINNGSVFVVGDGVQAATYNLSGGTLSIANGLLINSNATFTIANNGVFRAINGAVLESWGPVVNNGIIDVIYGNTNFHSTFINNGIVLTADGDPDGDGMTNLQESQAGTSPTNAASCLRVTGMTSTNNDVWITWTAVGGKSYVVQTNATPGSGFADFSPVISVPGIGESITNYVHTGGATNGTALFYRVRLGP